MADGPDPNREPPRDRELKPGEEADAGGLGDFRSSRLGLPSWLIVVIAVLLVALVLFLLGR